MLNQEFALGFVSAILTFALAKILEALTNTKSQLLNEVQISLLNEVQISELSDDDNVIIGVVKFHESIGDRHVVWTKDKKIEMKSAITGEIIEMSWSIEPGFGVGVYSSKLFSYRYEDDDVISRDITPNTFISILMDYESRFQMTEEFFAVGKEILAS